jgi:hypothetical protein
MKSILELIAQANQICATEVVGTCTADGVLAALAILETKRTAAQREFLAATPDKVADYFADEGEFIQTTTTNAAYLAVYGREGTTGELRTMASALRASGWVSYRSNGRMVWRRRDVATDGLYGVDNPVEVHSKVTAWAHETPNFRDTAGNIFRRIFQREPSMGETKAVGAVLRDCGVDARKNNGRLLFIKNG